MKSCFAMLASCLFLGSGNGFYTIPVKLLNGNPLVMSDLLEKKVIITTFDAYAPDTSRLQTLDSLQSATGDSIAVIAIPSLDFSDSAYNGGFDSLLSPSSSILITEPMHVKKGSVQDALPGWLTHADQNTHFDYDIESADKLFVVNGQGILYAIESGKLSVDYLTGVLHRNVDY